MNGTRRHGYGPRTCGLFRHRGHVSVPRETRRPDDQPAEGPKRGPNESPLSMGRARRRETMAVTALSMAVPSPRVRARGQKSCAGAHAGTTVRASQWCETLSSWPERTTTGSDVTGTRALQKGTREVRGIKRYTCRLPRTFQTLARKPVEIYKNEDYILQGRDADVRIIAMSTQSASP